MSYAMNYTDNESYPLTHDNNSFDYRVNSNQLADGYITDELVGVRSRKRSQNLIHTLRDQGPFTLHNTEQTGEQFSIGSPTKYVKRGKTPNAQKSVRIDLKK